MLQTFPDSTEQILKVLTHLILVELMSQIVQANTIPISQVNTFQTIEADTFTSKGNFISFYAAVDSSSNVAIVSSFSRPSNNFQGPMGGMGGFGGEGGFGKSMRKETMIFN